MVTPSGGNEFHGQALGFFTSDELRADPRVGLGQTEAVNFRQYDLGLSLGGPIRRDRLWYFVAYNPTFANQDALLAGLADQRDTQPHHLLAGKLTWRANARTYFAFTLLGDPFTHNSVTGSSDPLPLTVEPSVVLARQTGGGTTAAVHGRHEFSPGAQLNFSVSRLDRHNDFGPRSGSTSPSELARVDDFTANLSSGGFGYSEQSRESRTALRIATTLLRSTHTIKFGAEYEANSVLRRREVTV